MSTPRHMAEDGMNENPGFVPDGEAVGEGVETPQNPEGLQATEAVVEADPAADQAARVTELEQLVGERTNDLQRLQAEYVNYKKRVDRDRAMSKASGVESVVLQLLPVLDAIHLADEHGELTGGFKLVADELGKIAEKQGLTAFGAVGEPFDPVRDEALMQLPIEGGVEVTTISQVMQRGYELNGRVIRPARVAVAEPGA